MARRKRPDPTRLLRRPPDGRRSAVPTVLMRPDAESQAKLRLREMPTDDTMPSPGMPAMVRRRAYMLGECTVIVTPPCADVGWILSIAHDSRYPTWDEIAQARYRLLPADRWFAMYLPPPERYVNLHRFCFQLQECPSPEDAS